MSDLPVNIVKIGFANTADNPTAAVSISAMSNIIHLSMGSAANTLNGFWGFQKSGVAQAQYQVTTGKTLRIIGAYVSGENNFLGLLGYSTAALASDGGTGVPTGAVYYGGTSSGLNLSAGSTAYALVPLPHLVGMSFPALSYPFVKQFSAGGNDFFMTLVCVEQ
jgi:hypothetical protein